MDYNTMIKTLLYTFYYIATVAKSTVMSSGLPPETYKRVRINV